MKHYIKGTEIYAFEADGSQDSLITPDMQSLSDAEVFARLNPLSKVKERKLAELKQAMIQDETADVTVQGKVFPSDEAYQAKISRSLNQVGRGKPLPMSTLRGKDGTPVPATVALLNQIEDAITAQQVAAAERFGLRFDAVQAAVTVEQVNSIVW